MATPFDSQPPTPPSRPNAPPPRVPPQGPPTSRPPQAPPGQYSQGQYPQSQTPPGQVYQGQPHQGQPAANVAGGVAPRSPTAAPVMSARMAPVRQLFERVNGEIRKIYIGQDELVLGTLVALIAGGHVLIESVPGLGKTLFVRTLGRVLGCKYGRIQFTPDLMPSDITGSPVFDMKQQDFRFRPGPVFTQFLLADEINRAPAKTHAALLEIMQEYHVTVDNTTHPLERPFFVVATQNPIESEGTYNLPEAQLDRFMFKLKVEYPSAEEETDIIKRHGKQTDVEDRLRRELHTVTSPQNLLDAGMLCNEVRVTDDLVRYISQIVRRTREWPQFHLGASPRAGIALIQGARALAAFHGRDYAVPDDVVECVLPALRHRVSLTAEAEVEGFVIDDLLRALVQSVEVPRH